MLSKKQMSLKAWTKQKWKTKSGKKSSDTGERYLPEKAIKILSEKEYKLTTKSRSVDTDLTLLSLRYFRSLKTLGGWITPPAKTLISTHYRGLKLGRMGENVNKIIYKFYNLFKKIHPAEKIKNKKYKSCGRYKSLYTYRQILVIYSYK